MIHSNQAQLKLNVNQIEVICAANRTTQEVSKILKDITKKSFSDAEIRQLGKNERKNTIFCAEGRLKISYSGKKQSGRYQWNVILIPNYIL